MMEMEGKVALITGANRGLGLALSAALAEQGATVLMVCRDEEAGAEAARELWERELDVALHVADVASVSDIERLHDEVSAKFDRLDVLVNNAGVNLDEGDTTIETLPLATLEMTMDINFRGPVWLCHVFLPLLKRSESARIINYTSGLGRLSTPHGGNYPAYSMSKTAINGLTKVLAAEVEADGVIVNSVDPGWCQTDLGGPEAPRPVDEGITAALHLATADADELETGCLYYDREVISW
jgi:NAD(P)-dependent dehydrogenase (short-subunit alcohol dehydrogenase family)